MKTLAIIVFSSLCYLSTMAQDDNNEVRTVFGNQNEHSNGGYGALMINYTSINKLDGMTIGARGAWIIDHNFALGMGGYGFMTDPKFDEVLQSQYQINGGYGGLLFEPIVGAKRPIHLSFPILIGAGGVAYTKHWQELDPNYDYDTVYESSDAFFVLEPGIEIEFNMLKFFRLALSTSYRYTSDISLKYKDDTIGAPDPNVIGTSNMLRGWNFGLAMKFGKF